MNLDLNKTFDQVASRRIFYGALLLSVIVLVAGFFASKKLDVRKVEGKNDWLIEENDALSDGLSHFETLWKNDLERVAKKEVTSSSNNMGDYARDVYGVRQISLIKNKKITHTVTEFPTRTPVPLEPGFLNEKGDFIISRETVFSGADLKWLTHEKHPAIVVLRLNDAHAVILLLDVEVAAEITRDELSKKLSLLPLTVPAGSLRQIIDHHGEVLFQHGEVSLCDEPSDEITHHTSLFGQWTIRYWYPQVSVITYNWPLLMGGILLAGLIAFAGVLIARSQERALRLASERVSFVNAVSHELRTPLTNILLSTDLLLDEVTTESGQKRLSLIRGENQRLARMVENVLTFARVEKGTLDIGVHESFMLGAFLETCLQQFESPFARKHITAELSVPQDDQLDLPLDPLSQIVLNLLSNIEKYAGENVLITLVATVEAGEFILQISDDGIGIPISARKRIFRSFERVDDQAKSGITGAGLGLSISRELAQALGGDLTLEKSEQGATFQLKVPLH